MKRKFYLPAITCLAVIASLLFFVRNKSKSSPDTTKLSSEMKSEEENWRQASVFEYKITRDVSLGYVPKDRLLQTGEEMRQGRYARQNTTSRTEALVWTERGPLSDSKGPNGNTRPPGVSVSGRTDALMIDMADPTGHTIWAGTHSGGIWKTNDISAATPVWIPVFDNMANLGIGSIAQDPSNTDIMYAGTGDKTNFGDVRGGGIWKSTDHGLTWTLLPSTVSFWNITKVICDASGNIYAATNIGSTGIRRSSDGGITWTDISPAGLSRRIADMDLSENGTLHIYCGFFEGSTLVCGYRYATSPATVSAGSGWQAPATTFPLSNRTVQLAVTGNTLLALPVNDITYDVSQFYRSTDGGMNWTATVTTPLTNIWSCLDAAINPANPVQMISGSYDFFGTTNGGTTWSQQADGFSATPGFYVHHDCHAILWRANEIIIGCDGGVYFSNDNGLSFQPKNVGLRSFEFYTVNTHPTLPDYFLGGTQDNGTEQLSLPGLGPAIHVKGGDGGYTHVDQDEPQFQFCSYIFSEYRRSSNGGANWVNVNYSTSVGQFINPSDYDDAGDKMYCGANNDQYLRWEDPQTGSTFTTVAVPAFGGSKISSLVLSSAATQRMFTGLENGKVFRLDNIHTNSPSVTDISGTGRPAAYISSVNTGTNDNNLIVTYSNYGTQHVWTTTNGGTNWINVQGNLPDIPVRWGLFHPEDNDRAIIATDLGVWTTDDLNGAATVWVPETGLPAVRCSMLQYRANDRTLVVATYGRGIWTTTLPPTKPFIRFASPVLLSGTEETFQTTGCRKYKDYTVNLIIDMPPTGDAVVNLQVAGGATADQGADYDFTTNGNFATPSTQLIFSSGSAASQSFTLRIYDDMAVEGPESFSFTYSLSGATDALPAFLNQSYQVTITDNDTPPAEPAAFTNTIGVNNFPGTFQPFRGSFQKSRSQFIYLASEFTAAGFIAGPINSVGFFINSKQSTTPYNGLTISLKNTASTQFSSISFETGATSVYTGNYSTVAGMNTFNLISPFNWDGVSNLLVEICYSNSSVSFDDNINGTLTSAFMGVWARNNNATPGCTVPATTRLFGSTMAKPDITINGLSGKQIETIQGNTVTGYAFGGGNHYFYSNGTGNIISRMNNLSADPGCVTTTVFEAGNTWQSYLGGFRSQKVIEVTPSQNTGASYTIGVYYTAAELAGFTPSSLRLAKTTAATMAAANAGNTIVSPTTITPYGTGYLFTASFTGFSKFFLVTPQVVLPVTLISFSGQPEQQKVLLNWETGTEVNTAHFEVQRSSSGAAFTTIGRVTAAGFSTILQKYYFTDLQPGELNYYRLKTTDLDGRVQYSNVITIRMALPQEIWVSNTFSDKIKLRFAKVPQGDVMIQLLTGDGRSVMQKRLTLSGQAATELQTPLLAKGQYFLSVWADNRRYTIKLTRQ